MRNRLNSGEWINQRKRGVKTASFHASEGLRFVDSE
jgi:hypothetical protein